MLNTRVFCIYSYVFCIQTIIVENFLNVYLCGTHAYFPFSTAPAPLFFISVAAYQQYLPVSNHCQKMELSDMAPNINSAVGLHNFKCVPSCLRIRPRYQKPSFFQKERKFGFFWRLQHLETPTDCEFFELFN